MWGVGSNGSGSDTYAAGRFENLRAAAAALALGCSRVEQSVKVKSIPLNPPVSTRGLTCSRY